MKLFVFLILLFISFFSFAQNRDNIKGIITYFHDDNFGFKPDTGSKIIIAKMTESDTIKSPISKFTNYHIRHSLYTKIDKFRKTSKKGLKRIDELKDSLEIYKNKSRIYIEELETNINNNILIADIDGKYSISIPNGFYEIIVISKNRYGQIFNKFIKVGSNESNYYDFKFNKI